MKSIVKNLFLPLTFCKLVQKQNVKVIAIIPSYKPGDLTIRLVKDILGWNKYIEVYVVDDFTPKEYEEKFHVFEKIRNISDRVIIMRTPENKLKAAAINYALIDIYKNKDKSPDVILTLDDDVIIDKNTVNRLIDNLFEDKRFGAVCSQCGVINKNKNYLTRLQGLEYLGFNGIRLADEGFFRGPLVMHGMLSAFRSEALADAGLFAERHLIEDYEITARLKANGWHVRLAPHSYAWTFVPETFSDLWRQRARWNVGGLFVVTSARNWYSVIQDLIGHSLFLIMFILIICSFILIGHPGTMNPLIPLIIIEVSILQTLIWYFFQVWFMRFYRDKDWKDWAIRISLFPEFIYANFLTCILLGSYIFFIFHNIFSWLERKNKTLGLFNKGFNKISALIGYSEGWGTRQKIR